MLPAFVECLILVGIHSYLGLHVIRRKVIFVDLALAQVAALGTTVGFLFGILPGTFGSNVFSFIFAILGAAIFSITRMKNEKVPQEAIIGLVYAIAASVSILVIDRAPQGAEHIKDMMTGSILWVKWDSIVEAGLVYLLIGIFHYKYRDRFIAISDNPLEAYQRGISVRWWDFWFYVSFGVVITHSVNTAGVLLVFVFLVAPAIIVTMLVDSWKWQLILGWIIGLFVSFTGLLISYLLDLPSGPAVVAFYGITILLIALVLAVKKSPNPGREIMRIAFGLVFLIGFIIGLGQLAQLKWLKDEHLISGFHLFSHEHEEHQSELLPPAAGKEIYTPEIVDSLLQAHPELKKEILKKAILEAEGFWQLQQIMMKAGIDGEISPDMSAAELDSVRRKLILKVEEMK